MTPERRRKAKIARALNRALKVNFPEEDIPKIIKARNKICREFKEILRK